MADHQTYDIKTTDFSSLKDFLAELATKKRSHVRTAKVEDQGLVEPARQGNVLVMQPRVRIVATAFDHKANEILRWDEKWDVGSGTVRINVHSGQGASRDPTGTKTRDRAIAALEARGIQVARGEWTAESVYKALAGLDD